MIKARGFYRSVAAPQLHEKLKRVVCDLAGFTEETATSSLGGYGDSAILDAVFVALLAPQNENFTARRFAKDRR